MCPLNVEAAEKRLRDYLIDGVAAEVFWADEAYALAEEIGQHVDWLKAANFDGLFGILQVIMSDRQTLSITKIFEREDRRYPIRSIPSILSFLEANAELWTIPQRLQLHETLVESGLDSTRVEQLDSVELTRAVVAHYRSILPTQDRIDSCSLSRSLHVLRQSRDKVIAHNESIERSALQIPTWGDATTLVDYAKQFVTTIGFGFLGIDFGLGSRGYLLTYDAHRASLGLRRLLRAANLAGNVPF